MSLPFALPAFLPAYQQRLDRALDRTLPAAHERPEGVHQAMRHTLLAPSKRVRAVIAILSAGVCGDEDRAMAVAVAVELVHASSLILDDLPSMDDATLRRGKPTLHRVVGEANAILAAVAGGKAR